MENAEVLEMTVKKVEDILKNRTQGLHNSVQRTAALYTMRTGVCILFLSNSLWPSS